MRIVHRLSVTCCSLLFATRAFAAWSPSGNPVCTAPGFQGELVALPLHVEFETAHFNDLFVLWSDARDSIPSVTDLYTDLVDPVGGVAISNGSPLVVAPGFQGYTSAAVTAEGVSVNPSSTDVAVAWNDDRSGPLDVYATRVYGGGWPAGGVPVCTAPGVQFLPQICGDPSGGAIVAWLDQRDGFNAVYAQRLDPSGTPQWAANGIPVCNLPFSRSMLRVVRGPAGDAYLGWSDDRSGAPRTYVLLLDTSGAPAAGWPANGLEVTSLPATTFGQLVADGAGGVYVTMWSTAGIPVAQRLDAGGGTHAGWPAAGVSLRSSGIEGGLQDAVLHGTGLVVLWNEDDDPGKTTDMNLRAQSLLGDGTRATGWSPDGAVVCDAPGDQVHGRLVDGPPIVAVWEDDRSISSGPDVYAVRLQDDGTRAPEWPVDGVLVAGGNGRQQTPCPVWDGLGGVMVAYLDDHDFNSTETDVYAQIVSYSGRVDVPRRVAGAAALSAPVPNPARTEARLALAWPEGRAARVQVSDALGRHVRDLPATTGGSTLLWDLRDDAGRSVPPGLYFVRAEGGGRSLARTVIVRR